MIVFKIFGLRIFRCIKIIEDSEELLFIWVILVRLLCFALLACSVMSDSATPWTVAHQASLFMGLSWEEYWSGFFLQGIFLTQA